MRDIKFFTIAFFAVVLMSVSFLAVRNSHFLFGKNDRLEYVIELREDGFYPSELQVAKGDMVRFLTKRNQPFWPASNSHPTHDIYPEFDSRQPIDAGKSWSFKFDAEGIWKYHDHLFPLYKGTIIVGENDNISFVADKQNCNKFIQEDKQKTCWQSLLENTLNKSGLEEGFKLFIELAALQPSNCHQYAHDLGEYAAKAYLGGGKTEVNQEASYCGYGFWHGFTAKMLAESNFKQTKQFCEFLDSPSPELLPAVRDNCSHGIGIGLISDPPPVEFWGTPQSLIDPALGYCDTIKEEYSMRDNCYSGVFHAIVDYMVGKQYKFVFDQDNYFALCILQKEKYRSQCYFQIAPRIAALTNYNLPQVFKLVKQIPDARTFRHTFMLALTNFINQQMSDKEYIDFFHRCQSLDSAVSDICISGLLSGLFKDGIPGKEYIKGIELCSFEDLSDSDRSTCFENVISSSKSIYSESKIQEICNIIERKYHRIC